VTTVKSAWAWLSDEPHQRIGLRILQAAIGLLLLFRMFTEGRFALYLYGPHGLGTGSTRPILGAALGGLLDFPFASAPGTFLVMAVLGAAALALLIGYRQRLAVGIALVSFFMIERRLPDVGDGGDNVARLVLMYMLFALPIGTRAVRGSLAVWLHNVAVLAIATQLCILYEVSGLMKTMGDKWQHGTAIYYISQVQWFSHPAFRAMFRQPAVATLATYTPIFLLIFFPLAMLTHLRLPWIACGILFHLGIAFAMGLVTFATVMIGLELFMITDHEYARLRSRLGAARQTAASRLNRLRRKVRPTIALYIDGLCPHCLAAGHTLAALDLGGRLRIRSFRHDDEFRAYELMPAELERRMQAVDLRNGAVHAGYDAVRLLARELALLWPLRPVLALLAACGLGPRAYDWLAARRRILPAVEGCDASCVLAPGADGALSPKERPR
jgi:predicted DCC family thiol-disulfide oxidoreductase YuxK